MSKFFELITKWREAKLSMADDPTNVEATLQALVPALQVANRVADLDWTEVRQLLRTWRYTCQIVEESRRPLEEGNATSMEVRLFDEACLDRQHAAYALAQALSKLNLF